MIAVIRGKTREEAVSLGIALVRGGIEGIEITYTTPDCCGAIAELKAKVSASMVLGVGTVLSPEQLEAAVKAGATFAVSPHFHPEVVCAALEHKTPILPGAITPTEIVQAWESGATAIKLFPGSLVGPDYVKSLRGPFPDIPFVPTGGVSIENLQEWFDAGVLAVGMGGNLAKGTSEQVEQAARHTVAALNRIRTQKK